MEKRAPVVIDILGREAQTRSQIVALGSLTPVSTLERLLSEINSKFSVDNAMSFIKTDTFFFNVAGYKTYLAMSELFDPTLSWARSAI